MAILHGKQGLLCDKKIDCKEHDAVRKFYCHSHLCRDATLMMQYFFLGLTLNLSSANALNLVQSKNLLLSKELTCPLQMFSIGQAFVL